MYYIDDAVIRFEQCFDENDIIGCMAIRGVLRDIHPFHPMMDEFDAGLAVLKDVFYAGGYECKN